MDSIKQSIKHGVFATFLSKYSNIIIHLLVGIILARILSPKEFGVVSVVMVVVVFINMISDLGLGPAVIQRKELSNSMISSFFSLMVIIAITASSLFFFVAEPVSRFFNNPEYIKICRLLSASILFVSLNVVPLALLRRRKQFYRIAAVNVSVNIITGATAIFLAVKGYSYYSLIYRTILQGFLNFVLMFALARIRPTFHIRFSQLAGVWSYSFFQFAFSFVNYFARNIDKLTIGKFLGDANLGLYDNAYKLSRYPVENLAHVITPVLHPIFAEYSEQKSVIYENYKKVVHLLALVGLPVSVTLFIVSRELILLVYGSQWEGSVTVFAMLSLAIWVQMIMSSTGSVFQAYGKTNYMFVSGIITACSNLLAIYIGISHSSIYATALCLSLAFLFNLLQTCIWLVIVVMKENILDFLAPIVKPIVISLPVLLLYFAESYFQTLPLFYSFAAKTVSSGIIVLVLIFALGEYKLLLSFFFGKKKS